MSDNLRDRITAVVADAIKRSDMPPPEQISGCSDPECCGPVYDYNVEDVALDVADAVIEALSDVLKTSNSHACGVHCPYGPKDERCHHWTTDE